jgi:hypothetical protein
VVLIPAVYLPKDKVPKKLLPLSAYAERGFLIFKIKRSGEID